MISSKVREQLQRESIEIITCERCGHDIAKTRQPTRYKAIWYPIGQGYWICVGCFHELVPHYSRPTAAALQQGFAQ